MEILIPSLISALALGAFCCPALARPVDYLLSGGTIPTFDLTAVPDWWLSGGFAAHPAGTAATLALLFLISLFFFSMEQAKGCGEDGGVLGSARIKTGTELVRGRVVPGRGDRPPIEGLMPLSLMVRPSRSDTYCDPRSEWRVQPAGGLLRAIAILSASSASPASMRSDIDQPTALPGHMSITSARQGHPRRVRTQAMSANQALSGPSAVKSRPHRVAGGPGLRRPPS